MTNDLKSRAVLTLSLIHIYFTGITPALGENVVEICREACKAAKAHGVKISCDLNYRGKLWTREQARAAMTLSLIHLSQLFGQLPVIQRITGLQLHRADPAADRLVCRFARTQ